MWHELQLRGIPFERQVIVEVQYKGHVIGAKRIDIAGKVIVELRTVETLTPLHMAQVRTYLKIAGLKVGLLINFKLHHPKKTASNAS